MSHTLTDQDEFLHMDFPTDAKASWKENYYFSYVDKNADAMGMLHFSIHRHRGIAAIQSYHHIGGEIFSYRNTPAFPAEASDNKQLIVDDGAYSIEILEPMKRHKVCLVHEGTRIELEFEGRMPPYLFKHADEESAKRARVTSAMDVVHYEQSMKVSGEIHHDGKQHSISCLGHRDHTWGFREEAGIGGWEWAAFECEQSSWCISIVILADGSTRANGFMMKSGEEGVAIKNASMEVVEEDPSGAPAITRYKVELVSGETYTVVANCFTLMPIDDPMSAVVADENFSNFLVEETGEQGVGIDEHVRVKVQPD